MNSIGVCSWLETDQVAVEPKLSLAGNIFVKKRKEEEAKNKKN